MKKFFSIGLIVFLAGCSLLPEPNSPRSLYLLKSPCMIHSPVFKGALSVDEPTSEASLDTHRIAMTLLPSQREYIQNGEWPNSLPKILRPVLLETFGKRWGEAHVNRNEEGLETTYLLSTDIQDFSVYPMTQGCSEVRISIKFKLIDFKHKHIIAARVFSECIPLGCLTLTTLVEAFNKALHRVLTHAIEWLESVLKKEQTLTVLP